MLLSVVFVADIVEIWRFVTLFHLVTVVADFGI
jgi:hypothetical protein